MAKNGNIHPTRIFKEPKELEDKWVDYKADRKEQAKDWPITQYVGKDGEQRVHFPTLPLTLEGFKVFCRKDTGEAQHYFDNTGGYYEDFCVICRAIREEIRDNQITGGLVNQFNSSITQRLNGLTDKIESNVTQNIKLLNIDPLDDSTDS